MRKHKNNNNNVFYYEISSGGEIWRWKIQHVHIKYQKKNVQMTSNAPTVYMLILVSYECLEFSTFPVLGYTILQCCLYPNNVSMGIFFSKWSGGGKIQHQILKKTRSKMTLYTWLWFHALHYQYSHFSTSNFVYPDPSIILSFICYFFFLDLIRLMDLIAIIKLTTQETPLCYSHNIPGTVWQRIIKLFTIEKRKKRCTDDEIWE